MMMEANMIAATQSGKVPFSKAAFRQELEENILHFWSTKMSDGEHGGFYGRIDDQNVVCPNADKGLILNARILWTYAAAYDLVGNSAYYNFAHTAFNALRDFRDPQNKGMYWALTYDKRPANTKKQIYAQAFAIYGMSEYYKISNNPLALSLAIELFDLIELHSLDEEKNGYLEAFDEEWNLLEDLRLSEKDDNEVKTMNTHLHILEAYSNLYKIWPDHRLKRSLTNLIELFLTHFLDDDYHFKLFFDEDWNLKSDEISYGHDIETGWLVQEAAETLADHELIKKSKELANRVTDATMPFFDQDGGLFNAGTKGKTIDTDKHWWPQAEALVGLVNAYQNTGKPTYLEQAKKTWGFIEDKIIDQDHGEWIWGIQIGGIQMMGQDKAGPWKCPYHNGRAMMELMKRL